MQAFKNIGSLSKGWKTTPQHNTNWAKMAKATSTKQRRTFANASEAEQRIAGLLKTALKTDQVEVVDISGGCGAMYKVHVASKEFQGKSIVQQHKMVNDTLAEEMKKMHGLTINTRVLS